MTDRIGSCLRQGKTIIEAALDLLFPGATNCAGCGATLPASDKYICPSCRAAITPIAEPVCKRCNRPLAYPGFCELCRKRQRPFIRSWSAALYKGALRRCIHQFKYERAVYLSPFLASLIFTCLQTAKELPLEPLVVPVPLDRQRLRWRGFNQAEMLAEELARRCQWPLERNALRRFRITRPQADLNEVDRWSNVSGAFVAGKDLTGKEILLIDDIYTTGATAEAASQALLDTGAKGVYVATVAMASSHPRGRASRGL
jgi:ComF family protein